MSFTFKMKSVLEVPQVKNRKIMENHRRSAGKTESLHVDASSRDVSASSFRSHSNDLDHFPQSPASSCISMFSSRASDAEAENDPHEIGFRSVMLQNSVEDLIQNESINHRYPHFIKFLQEEDTSGFVPSSHHERPEFARPTNTTDSSEMHKELGFEMLDAVYLYLRQKQITTSYKRANDELKETNKQLRIASVQIYAKAEQEEEYISNSLFKKIQQLKQDKEFLMRKYQQDEESLTNELMAHVQKIPEVHAEVLDTEKLMADKQAEIERLKAHCSRAEQNYQQELLRLRADKINHESALEQEQELLINTLGKRMSQTNEEKRKIQQALEKAYLNGFVDYNEGVEFALRASAAQKYGIVPSASPTMRNGAPSPMIAGDRLTDAGNLFLENQRLTGLAATLTQQKDAIEKEKRHMEALVLKHQRTIEMMKAEARSLEQNMTTRLNVFNNRIQHGQDQPHQSVVHPVQVVSAQPHSLLQHSNASSAATAHVVPVPRANH